METCFPQNAKDIVVFHAGTSVKQTGQEDTVITSGGRVMTIVGIAQGLQDARKTAYEGVEKICFDGIQYRTDIASRALKYVIAFEKPNADFILQAR